MAYRAYQRKINSFVAANLYKLPGQGMTADDLRAELHHVLWRAVITYDPNRGSKFNTHFWTCVNNRFKSLLRRGAAKKRISDIGCESLTFEAVAQAVDDRLSHLSAEDEVLAPLVAYEIYLEEVGDEAISMEEILDLTVLLDRVAS